MRKLSTTSPDEDYCVTMAVEISRSQVVTLGKRVKVLFRVFGYPMW